MILQNKSMRMWQKGKTKPSKFHPAFSVKSVSLYSSLVKLYWLNYNGSLNSS